MDQPSPLTHSLLTPMLALVVWTLVMTLWMYAMRIPAMQKAGIDPANAQEPTSLDPLPLKVRQVGYNLNNLMEQPTIFYATALSLAFLGQGTGLNAWLAWAYVALRVIHSLVQSTSNVIMVRFSIFMLGSVVLVILAIRAAMAVF